MGMTLQQDIEIENAKPLVVDFETISTPSHGPTAGCGPASDKSQTRHLEKHEHLFFEGDEATQFFEIEEGFLCVYKLMPDGRRHVVSFGFPGDLVALSEHGYHRYSAEAIEDASVRCLPKTSLQTVLEERPDFARKIIEFTSAQLDDARDQLLCVARRSATERVATFLMSLSRRNANLGKDEAVIDIPMTRLDIADFLGLTLETVSRTISKLKTKGIIELPHSSVVIVKKMDQLSALAEV